jgi:hypothetical protein
MVSFIFQGLVSTARNISNTILYASAIVIQIAIKLCSKYLNYYKNGGGENQTSVNNKSEHTVSLGSATFFALVLTTALMAKFGTRQTRLFFLMPLQITAMSVFFPLIIIFGDPKLRRVFSIFIKKPLSICLNSYAVNKIHPII